MSTVNAAPDKSASRFWSAFWEGMAGAGLYCPITRRAPLPADDLSALRSDLVNCGEDFHAAIRKARTSRPAA